MPAKTHGFGGKEKLYSIWSNMRNRCNNPRCKDYKYYGGKGVSVCKEWDDYMVFRKWSYENGYSPNKKVSIDRIDSNGGYEPSNCRWADRETQANNMSSNHLITINGETKNLTQWAKEFGLPPKHVETRIRQYGWDEVKALSTPINNHRIYVEYDGEKRLLSDLAEEYDIKYMTLYNRLYTQGWDLKKALITRPKVGGHYV